MSVRRFDIRLLIVMAAIVVLGPAVVIVTAMIRHSSRLPATSAVESSKTPPVANTMATTPSADFARFVGEWHVHGTRLEVHPDMNGLLVWNSGPCDGRDDMCAGYERVTFQLEGDMLVGRIESIEFKTNQGEVVGPQSGSVDRVGDTLRLSLVATGVLMEHRDPSKPSGNDYFCRADASADWHNQCNA